MKHFRSLESLRGWMAWWVVLGHAFAIIGLRRYVWGPASTALLHNDLAVQVFMMVSGFVIAHLIITKREPYPAYLLRRWMRIAPLFLFVMVIALITRDLYQAAYVTNPLATHSVLRVGRLASEQAYWPIHLALHGLMAHGVVPDTLVKHSSTAFLPPGWSLSLEWQFYIVAPALLAAMRFRNRWTIALAGVVAMAVSLSGKIGSWAFPSFLPLVLPMFLIGIASRLWFEGEKARPAMIACISFFVWLLFKRSAGLPTIFAVLPIWAVAMTAVAHEAGQLRLPAAARGLFRFLFLNSLAGWFGRVSYSTYLIHMPLLWICVGFGVRLSVHPSAALIYACAAVAIILTIPASWVLYTVVERPGERLGRAMLRRPDSSPTDYAARQETGRVL